MKNSEKPKGDIVPQTNNTPIPGQIAGDKDALGVETVANFGAQWRYFTQNEGYYASDTFFADLLFPLLTPLDFQNVTCAEIGAGTGNIAAMALRAGVTHFIALEPSDAVLALRKNLAEFGNRHEIIHALGGFFCINRLLTVHSLSLDRLIPRLQQEVCRAA